MMCPKAWDNAAIQLMPFEQHTISVDYKQDKLEFEVYTQSLWDWALDSLQEPLLAPHFLWTADRWWHIQSKLPNNGVPFTINLYTNKTHLSSSGIVKGYLVIACCGNLPVKIRNTTGMGGGRVVGWLPIAITRTLLCCTNNGVSNSGFLQVPKDADRSGKLSYTNIKCMVWHKAFLKLLELVIIFSKTGFTHKSNFDNIMCWLFPLILLLCVMALIWGTGSNCPCPICLVPMAKLSDHAATYPIRTVEDAQDCLKLYQEDHVAGEENSFWKVWHSNPHETISQDPLHVFHSGLFGKHFWTEVKKLLENLGCSALKKVNDQFTAFPWWRKLNHFNSVTNISYSDRNKLQDISKQLLYAAQNVLTQEEDEAGYALLKCIASYLHIDMYISLDVHTESIITAGEAKVLVFQKCMAVHDYIIAAHSTELGTKSLNFLKMHSLKHIFQDIWEKGAALQLQYITKQELEDEDSNTSNTYNTLGDGPFLGHIYLGSTQSPTTFVDVERGNQSKCAFNRFHQKFTKFINEFLLSHDIPLLEGTVWLKSAVQDKLQEYCYLKVNYESTVDWKLATDYLQCNPNFHGQERYDCALIHTLDKDGNNKNIFVQILFIFKYTVGDKSLDLALMLPMDTPLGACPTVDHDL
ncbi:hypothetical protein DFH29DRAFT_884029 [Suillus ampliporus]|nr:hypothetical protein DFH29DRAFT_884029 [Suillus ampliporus]